MNTPPESKGEERLAKLNIFNVKTLGPLWLEAKAKEAAAPLDIPWPGDPSIEEHSGPLNLSRHALKPYLRPVTRVWTKFANVMKAPKPGWLVLLVGGSGKGKSALLINIAEAAARKGAPVLYVSVELDSTEILARFIAARTTGTIKDRGVAHSDLASREIDPEILAPAVEQLAADCPNLYVFAPRAAERNARRLVEAVWAVSEAHGNTPVVLMLDYIQRFAQGDDPRVATKELSGKLRDISRVGGLTDGWPGAVVWAISSAPRNAYTHFASCTHLRAAFKGGEVPTTGKPKKNGEPQTTFQEPIPVEGLAKESGELEYDATHVLAMTSNKGGKADPTAPRRALVVIAKNRFGVTGDFDFDFHPASGRFDQAPAGRGAHDPAYLDPALVVPIDEMPF
jgi:hypothetical protein